MGALLSRFRAGYGANPLHLLATLASFALLGYVVTLIGPAALWNTQVWWQSILLWFLGAVVLHDFVLFPLYAAADRLLSLLLRRERGSRPVPAAVNYVRVPLLATGLTFLLFFPGIIQQGASSYHAATGQTQQPFLARWLLLTAVFFALSALAYSVKLTVVWRRARQAQVAGEPS